MGKGAGGNQSLMDEEIQIRGETKARNNACCHSVSSFESVNSICIYVKLYKCAAV